jgi:predicted nucleic acid-binding protein
MAKEEVRLLFDASALYPELKIYGVELYDLAKRSAVLDLTKYELGNAIRKGAALGKISDWKGATAHWGEICSRFAQLAITDMVKVEEIAMERGLSFYDASYVHTAEELKIHLITEDEGLLNSSRNATRLGELKGKLRKNGQFLRGRCNSARPERVRGHPAAHNAQSHEPRSPHRGFPTERTAERICQGRGGPRGLPMPKGDRMEGRPLDSLNPHGKVLAI